MIGKILKKFSKLRVAVIGDIMLDKYQYADVERISPEAPVPILKLRNGEREERPGGAANVALNISTLGADVHLFGVVGQDTDGKDLLSLLKSHGIRTDGIFIDHERPTTSKTRIISRKQQIVRIDIEKTEPIPRRIEKEIKNILSNEVKNFDAIVVEDYNKGVLTPGIIRFISKELTDKTIVGVDPKIENFGLYKNVTLFKPNRTELSRFNGKKDLFEAIKDTFEKLSPEYMMVTLSEAGMVVYDGREFVRIPSLKKEVYDVTGAGDTVISVAILSLVAGLSIVDSAILSTIAAGIEVSKFGVACVRPDELREEFRKHYASLKEKVEIQV